MEHIGIDVHKRDSQICILSDEGTIVLERRVRTERGRFAEILGGRAKARVLIEMCGEAEWVARCLEGLGHEVVVADPGFAPMYFHSSRRVKTDRRDARTLAEALRLGSYRTAHRISDEQRHMKAHLAVREALVTTRAKYVVLAQALVRRTGLRVPPGSAAKFAARLAKLELPAEVAAELAPLLAMLPVLNEQIDACDEVIERASQENEAARLLQTVPGVGPITAVAFVSVVDDAKRFGGAHQLEAYLGLVPREHSSGDTKHRGRITKAGDRRMRALLIQAALRLRRLKKASAYNLVAWSERIAARRGKRIAVVALARRLAGVLFAMMRDRSPYCPRPAAADIA